MVKRFTTHRIPLTGERTLLARVWPGDGSPIVFLHGIFGSSESWDGICSTLDRPCIAFDLPGFGGSDLPSAPDVSAYAGDVAAALLELIRTGRTTTVSKRPATATRRSRRSMRPAPTPRFA